MRFFTLDTLALCFLLWTAACGKGTTASPVDGSTFRPDVSDVDLLPTNASDSRGDGTRDNADSPSTSDQAKDGPSGAVDAAVAAGVEAGTDTSKGVTDATAADTDGSAGDAHDAAHDGVAFDGYSTWDSTDVPGSGLANMPTETHSIVEFFIPDLGILESLPMYIAAGSDGNMWFTSSNQNSISRITVDGMVTPFPIPTGGYVTNSSNPGKLVLGPDVNLWFRESNKIASISAQGVITEMNIPAPATAARSITFGSDGAIWFTQGKNAIGRLTMDGSLNEYQIPIVSNPDDTTGEQPKGITMGPDGNLWFADSGGPDIARMPLSGTVTQFKAKVPLLMPDQIAAGGDGTLWFTASQGRIGQITTSGTMTIMQFPDPDMPQRISASPDGNLWIPVLHIYDGYIVRISPTGAMTKLPIPTKNGGPNDVAVGPDGKIWFTEWSNCRVGYLLP